MTLTTRRTTPRTTRSRSVARTAAQIAAGALIVTGLGAITAPQAQAAGDCTLPAPTLSIDSAGAKVGGKISITGSGWKACDGTASKVAIKIDDGLVSRNDGQVFPANPTVWALVDANAAGELNGSLTLPNGVNSTPRFTTGAHTFRLLTGSLNPEDPLRSLTHNFSVAKADTAVSLKLKPKTVKAGKRGKAVVDVGALPAPTGKVTIKKGAKTVGSAKLKAASKGKVTITLAKLGKGRHRLVASYAGDALSASASSSAVVLTVKG